MAVFTMFVLSVGFFLGWAGHWACGHLFDWTIAKYGTVDHGVLVRRTVIELRSVAPPASHKGMANWFVDVRSDRAHGHGKHRLWNVFRVDEARAFDFAVSMARESHRDAPYLEPITDEQPYNERTPL